MPKFLAIRFAAMTILSSRRQPPTQTGWSSNLGFNAIPQIEQKLPPSRCEMRFTGFMSHPSVPQANKLEIVNGIHNPFYSVCLSPAGLLDGAIRHVMSGVNPQGCEVFSFKQPSAEELEHDFLWRTTCRLPERGRIGIFNRSYYEEVLIVRVHPEILGVQGLSEKSRDGKNLWKERHRSIVDLEEHLHRNDTRIIKFFLHLSKDEQRKRFLERIDEPDKNWKFSLADIHERKYWKHYMQAYEDCLTATSTNHAPWHVVPADDKEDTRLIVSQIILDAFNELKMTYPKTKAKRWRELKSIRRQL
jgi:PPK2 family polyphosphate:nucleotide phosphotransferase